MPQFANAATYRINFEHIAIGLTIFILGLSKKVLIADSLAVHATPFFNAVRDGQVLTLLESWVGALAYSLQLYFDFSGYSDMAIGLSLIFNIRLPLNFDSPYKATNIIDFWRRWHMTLSAFLRDYLYIPLGGNRKGSSRRYFNLFATMLLGGLWHGAGWTFIVWGGLHGLYLIINHSWRELKSHMGWGNGGRCARIAAGALTFLAVVVAWVFFRADSFSAASSMLSSMAGMHGTLDKWAPVREGLKVILPCLLLVWLFPNVGQIMRSYKPTWEDMTGKATPAPAPQGLIANFVAWKPKAIHQFLIGFLFFVSLSSMTTKVSEFLYFQF